LAERELSPQVDAKQITNVMLSKPKAAQRRRLDEGANVYTVSLRLDFIVDSTDPNVDVHAKLASALEDAKGRAAHSGRPGGPLGPRGLAIP
jgi:hypothetical protein